MRGAALRLQAVDYSVAPLLLRAPAGSRPGAAGACRATK
jgi:hypothetical protein